VETEAHSRSEHVQCVSVYTAQARIHVNVCPDRSVPLLEEGRVMNPQLLTNVITNSKPGTNTRMSL
jgi:hypothetical protein